MTQYEIRTCRDRPVFAYDDLARAKLEMRRAEQRIGIKLRLIEITRVEKEIAA